MLCLHRSLLRIKFGLTGNKHDWDNIACNFHAAYPYWPMSLSVFIWLSLGSIYICCSEESHSDSIIDTWGGPDCIGIWWLYTCGWSHHSGYLCSGCHYVFCKTPIFWTALDDECNYV